MKIIYNSIFLNHDTGPHPENKKRLESLGRLSESTFESGEKYLLLVHQKDYIEHVKNACREARSLDADTLTSRGSYQASVYAVGAAVEASEKNDFALVRPPGHHAYPDHSSGFCLFNNIAIAVQKLVKKSKKVFILDIDGHLGDGTMKFFYQSDQVLFVSLHQYPAFPGGGWIDETGKGKGKGYTINLPLPPGSGDDIFLSGISKIIPKAIGFKPDTVAVSAGFDGHQYDPLLDLKYTVNSYYRIGRILSENFSDVFVVLEGGYNLEWLPKCIYSFLAGINKKKQPYKEKKTVSESSVLKEYRRRIGLL